MFADDVAYPFRLGFASVQKVFHEAGIADRVTRIASGKVGLPNNAIIAFALGASEQRASISPLNAWGGVQVGARCRRSTTRSR